MRKIVFSLTALFFLTIAVGGVSPLHAAGSSVELAANPSVMQCMTSCIKHEGNTATAKSTCKLRCANVAMPGAQGGNRDCMGVYKKCNRTCPKGDKSCRKGCKAQLMQCK